MQNNPEFAVHPRTTILAEDVPPELHPLVYFIGPALCRGEPVKIGTTTNLAQRFRSLNLSSPVQLTVHAVARGDRHREADFHYEFRKYRLHGEWFRLTPSLINRIEAYQMIFAANLAYLEARAA